MRQDRRHKLQLFYEILCAIEDDMITNEIAVAAKPTHVQHYSRLSYDKMVHHLGELERKEMIYRHDNSGLISITSKGLTFIKQYRALIILIESVGLKDRIEIKIE
ncbi:MAG TPA: winged helix-turn-helix domain-containing protein [Nitrososphaeraceae archaeon]